LARDRIVRFMRTRTRLAAAARVRREMEYHQEAVKARLTRDAMKIEALADMRDAMCRARVDKMRTGRIGLDQWRSNTVLERSITPVGSAFMLPSDALPPPPTPGLTRLQLQPPPPDTPPTHASIH
jgi:hypothetical protein